MNETSKRAKAFREMIEKSQRPVIQIKEKPPEHLVLDYPAVDPHLKQVLQVVPREEKAYVTKHVSPARASKEYDLRHANKARIDKVIPVAKGEMTLKEVFIKALL